MSAPEPILAQLTRDGVVESVHRGSVAVCTPDGVVVAALGDPRRDTYVRSSVKPFQALAVLELLGSGGPDLGQRGLAIASASHFGGDDHQIEAARLLALADLDESALRCPPAIPVDHLAALSQREPTPLAHNCSGKHAAFLLAQVATGRDPSTYLAPDEPLQKAVFEQLRRVSGETPLGPGVDGCGAPAWRLPLAGLATAFARLAEAGEGDLLRVSAAMSMYPDLVGGPGSADTALMQADGRVLAKRGAEAVFAAAAALPNGPVGIAVKIADGGNRAAAPVAACLLSALGARTPEQVRRPAVLGGGRPHGALEVDEQVHRLLSGRG